MKAAIYIFSAFFVFPAQCLLIRAIFALTHFSFGFIPWLWSEVCTVVVIRVGSYVFLRKGIVAISGMCVLHWQASISECQPKSTFQSPKHLFFPLVCGWMHLIKADSVYQWNGAVVFVIVILLIALIESSTTVRSFNFCCPLHNHVLIKSCKFWMSCQKLTLLKFLYVSILDPAFFEKTYWETKAG